MTPEERSLLERTNKLAEENNAILRSMRRASRFALIIKLTYWVVILFLAYGALHFIQPYLMTILDLTGKVQGSLQGVQGTTSTMQNTANTLLDLLKK